MNQAELIAYMANRAKVPRADAGRVLKALVAAIDLSLMRGSSVAISGLGIFKLHKTKARAGVNPKTRAPLSIPAQRTLKLRVARSFKERIN